MVNKKLNVSAISYYIDIDNNNNNNNNNNKKVIVDFIVHTVAIKHPEYYGEIPCEGDIIITLLKKNQDLDI